MKADLHCESAYVTEAPELSHKFRSHENMSHQCSRLEQIEQFITKVVEPEQPHAWIAYQLSCYRLLGV